LTAPSRRSSSRLVRPVRPTQHSAASRWVGSLGIGLCRPGRFHRCFGWFGGGPLAEIPGFWKLCPKFPNPGQTRGRCKVHRGTGGDIFGFIRERHRRTEKKETERKPDPEPKTDMMEECNSGLSDANTPSPPASLTSNRSVSKSPRCVGAWCSPLKVLIGQVSPRPPAHVIHSLLCRAVR